MKTKKYLAGWLAGILLIIIAFTGASAGSLKNDPAPNFALNSLDGREISLDQFRGKYLLINFWATWCGPCKMEMASLEALHRQFKSRGLVLLGISGDMFGAKVVQPFVKAHQLSFTILLDPLLHVSHRYGVVGLPTTYLIDPRGKIIGIHNGPRDWASPDLLRYFQDLLNPI